MAAKVPLRSVTSAVVTAMTRGKHTPLTAALEQVQQGVEDLVQIYCARLGAFAHRFQQWTNPLKLLLIDIARIGFSWPHLLLLLHQEQ
jgi:hypothetical protein